MNKSGRLSDFVTLNDNESLTIALYNDKTEGSLRLIYQIVDSEPLRIESISPNPFSDISVISVFSADQSPAQVYYYNTNGQVVAQQDINLIRGLNAIRVSIEDLGGNTGMIHFVIKAEDTAQRGKLLLIR